MSSASDEDEHQPDDGAAVKAVRWIQEFGTPGVVPAAVLSGVFHLPHLVAAQSAGLTSFGKHTYAYCTMTGCHWWLES